MTNVDVDFSFHGNISNADGPYDLSGAEGHDTSNDDEFVDANHGPDIITPIPTAAQKRQRSNDLNFSYHGNMSDRLGVERAKGIPPESASAHADISSGPWDLRGDEQDITEEDIMAAAALSSPSTAEKKKRSNDLNFSFHGNMNHRMGGDDLDGSTHVGRMGDKSCFCVIS